MDMKTRAKHLHLPSGELNDGFIESFVLHYVVIKMSFKGDMQTYGKAYIIYQTFT